MTEVCGVVLQDPDKYLDVEAMMFLVKITHAKPINAITGSEMLSRAHSQDSINTSRNGLAAMLFLLKLTGELGHDLC